MGALQILQNNKAKRFPACQRIIQYQKRRKIELRGPCVGAKLVPLSGFLVWAPPVFSKSRANESDDVIRDHLKSANNI